eukprot:10292096-Ditylum_brightwellii.AAC.1
MDHMMDLWDHRECVQLIAGTISMIWHKLLANQQAELEEHVAKTFVNVFVQGSYANQYVD